MVIGRALSVVVITYNEENNLARCLESLTPLGCSIFVVDSGSTDATVGIARRYGAHVVEHEFSTYLSQWLWALETLPLDTDWVLALDADQRLTPELRGQLFSRFADSGLGAVAGFYVRRRLIFRGHWIRYGGMSSKYMLKIFKRRVVFFDKNDLLDHHFYVQGRTELLSGELIEENRNEYDLTRWFQKHITYAKMLAAEEFVKRQPTYTPPLTPALFGSPDQRVLYLKRTWRRLPYLARPWLYFVYRYVILGGCLDGRAGLVFHMANAFWLRMLVDLNLESMTHAALSRFVRNAGGGEADSGIEPTN